AWPRDKPRLRITGAWSRLCHYRPPDANSSCAARPVRVTSLLRRLPQDDGVRGRAVAFLEFQEDLVEAGVVVELPIPSQHEHLPRLPDDPSVLRWVPLHGKEATVEVLGQMIICANAIALDPTVLVIVVAAIAGAAGFGQANEQTAFLTR